MVEPITGLHRHPEVAQQVGLIIAEYAVLEYFLFVGYAMIAPTDVMTSFNEFFGLRSVNKRYELSKNAAKSLDSYRRRAHERVWRHFKGAAARRTEIAHCMYTVPGADRESGEIYRMRADGRGVRYEIMNPAVFNRTMGQFRTLGTELAVFLVEVAGGLERALRIIDQLPSPPGARLLPRQAGSQDTSWFAPDEQRAALARLGLDEIPVPPDYATMEVSQNFHVEAEPQKEA